MRYSNTDFTVVYVDPSRTSAGDGSTPANALRDLPRTADALADGTCYLIRRTAESYSCTVPDGTNYDLADLALLGMPLASDGMWELVPEEARTAWGSDAARYANVKSVVSDGSLRLPSVQRLLIHRVYLFRDNIAADDYILRLGEPDAPVGCLAFEHCRFGSMGVNLDKASYTGALTAGRCKGYACVEHARIVDITDCVVNHAVTGGSSNADGIRVQWADVLNVQDVSVYSAAGTDYGQCYPLNLSGTADEGVECNIVNVSQTIRRNGSAGTHVPLLLRVQGYVSMNVRDLRVANGAPLSSERPSSYTVDYPAVLFSSVREVDADGIDMDYPECWSCREPVLEFERCYASTYVPGVSKRIRNVSVRMADSAGIGNPVSYEYAAQTGSANAAVSIDFSNRDGEVSAKVPCVDSITVRCPRGKAFFGENLRITDAEFEGTVCLEASVADIRSLKTWFPGRAIHVSDGSHARVRHLECNVDNPSYPYDEDPAVSSTFDDDGSLFVDESNTTLRPMASEPNAARHVYQGVGCNNEGANGHFAFRCANGLCDTWSVHRVGGGAAALKLSNNSCPEGGTMVLGRRPFNGMQLTPTTTGRHILRAHIAFKGYAKPSEMHRRFLISVQTGGRTYYSGVHGRWADDPDSVWVNDSELTRMVLELPLDLPEVAPVDVRVYFSWYSAGGFVYLDPDIELEAV